MATRLVVGKSEKGMWSYVVIDVDSCDVLRAHGGFKSRKQAVRHAVGG